MEFFDSITNLLDVIRLWRMRKRILEENISVFKPVPISKIVREALLTTILNSGIEEKKQIQKMFFMRKQNTQNQTRYVM